MQQSNEKSDIFESILGLGILFIIFSLPLVFIIISDNIKSKRGYEQTLKSAQQGNAESQYIIYLKLINTNQSDALHWLNQSANSGFIDAQIELAKLNYSQNNYQDSAYWNYQAAPKNNSQAQYNLAEQLANGQGIEQDNELALYWYHESAKEKYIEAQFKLAKIYRDGLLGQKQNKEKSIHYLNLVQANQDYEKFKDKHLSEILSFNLAWINVQNQTNSLQNPNQFPYSGFYSHYPNHFKSNQPMALCCDGVVSYSDTRRGTCSHHKGVCTWYRKY